MSSSACYDDTVTYHWYFKRNAGSTAGPVGKTNNMITTPTLDQSGVRISPKSSPRFPLPVLIGSASGPIVGIVLLLGTIILTTWFKSRFRPPLAGLDPNVGSNKNTAVSVIDSGNDHQYEDINDHYGQTGQGQANIQSLIVGNLSHDQVLAALSPNPTYLHTRNNPASTEMTRQGQSRAIIESTTHTKATVMTSGDDHQYEDVDNNHVKTDQVQSPALPESNTNATEEAMTSGSDHQYEDVDNNHVKTGQVQSPTLPESNTNATAMTSGDDHQYEDVDNNHVKTGQVQSPALPESNTNATEEAMTSGSDHQYEDVDNNHVKTGQAQSPTLPESNTNATAMTSGDDHQYEDVDNNHVKTDQVQSPTLPESNTNATAMTSGDDHQYEDVDKHHDQTGQGQSPALPESNTNATAEAMTYSGSDHQYEDINNHYDQTRQGQSKAISGFLDARNLSYGTGPTVSQQNDMCKVHSRDLTESNTNNIASVMASSHCQTKQVQSQAITKSLDTENVFYGGGPTALHPNSLYADGETP
ncbi:hypothetical protein Bbelb_192030 [Branchiostoma belcheri]|nr:hypothetical protein Bbelb_192030 [Branchiostoma belcheri]